MDTPLKVDARSPKGEYDKYGKEIVWPKSREEWLAFDMNTLKPGTKMPPHFKTETPPEKYILNGMLQHNKIPKEEQWRYKLPNTIDEPDIERNPDGTIIIEDKKQKQIDRLTRQLEALPEGKQLLQLEEQQKTIDALTSHLTALTNQMNEITKKIKK